MAFLRSFWLAGFCVIAMMSSAVMAGEFFVSGPHELIRETGKPLHQRFTFEAPREGDIYILRVHNGTDGRDAVTSGRISLNGHTLVRPQDFKNHGGLIEHDVSLNIDNELAVEINGKPGSGLTLEVVGVDNDDPTISAVIEPPANAAGWHNDDVTVSFRCQDELSGILSCTEPVLVGTEGADQVVTGEAVDRAQNTAATSVTVNLDTTPPDLQFTAPQGGANLTDRRPEITLSLDDNLALNASSLELAANGAVLAASCHVMGGSAQCTPQVDLPAGQVTLGAGVGDLAGNRTSASVTVTVIVDGDGDGVPDSRDRCPDTPAGTEVGDDGCALGGALPPDPETVAPSLDSAGITPFSEATAFLYAGDTPIQTGMTADTIEPRRAAVVRGSVLTRDGEPLSGVTIRINGHPEFGQTLTRTDGLFDLAVNGGGPLIVNYEKAGYLPVQRTVYVPWGDFALPDDVVMIPLDEQVTAINMGSGALQVAQGSVQTDDDGSRQATVLFPGGTRATMTLPDGSTKSLSTINVRATEYTVGDNGPQAMPGRLPPTSGYTYAVELSVDAAIAAGATRVDFSQPLPFYVENFLDFPTGSPVPAGWYDREKAAWIASDNGRVIEILGITDGAAELDVDGSGQPAASAALSALGITDAERRQLASLYSTGKTLWRTPVTHFTPWDCNWPYGPPEDAEPPQQPEPDVDEQEPETDCQDGSIIECQNAVLRERIPVASTPFSLNYRSGQVPGRKAYIDVQLSDDQVPASLQGIELHISIAGQHHVNSFPAQTNLSYRFVWDGNDSYGRPVTGVQKARIRIGYVYEAVYYTPEEFESAFGRAGGAPITGNRARQTITIWQKRNADVQARAPGAGELGAWAITPQHRYDLATQTLVMGNGTLQNQRSLTNTIETVAGSSRGFGGDGGTATEAQFDEPHGIAIAPDGSLYIADTHNHRIRRVNPKGIIATIAGSGPTGAHNGGYRGNSGPAIEARLNRPTDLTIGPDGSVYIADYGNHRIRQVTPDGNIRTVAGTGERGFSGDGRSALRATLNFPSSVAISTDGSIYIADSLNHIIRRIDSRGVITTVAGTGDRGYSGDGGPAIQAALDYPIGVAISANGGLYIVDSGNGRVRHMGGDGIITTVAGNGEYGFNGDGGPATEGAIRPTIGVRVSNDGSLFIADTWNHRVRRVTGGGTISTIAGDGESDFAGDSGPSLAARLSVPRGLAIGPDNNLYIVDSGNTRIRRVNIEFNFTSDEILVPSEDSAQIFRFDKNGRHLDTRDAATGSLIYQFHHDENHKLARIEDGDGNLTYIERDFEGRPLAIVAPDGQRTDLSLDANGYLASVSDPEGHTYRMRYTADGLLTHFTDPNGNRASMSYDEVGRLKSDTNAEDGGWSISRLKLGTGHEYLMTSAEGRDYRYQVTPLPTGGQLRTNIRPDGTETITQYSDNGEKVVIGSDGTRTTTLRGPDPRFSMVAPVPKRITTETPNGLVRTVTATRTAQLADEDDLLSHTALGRTISINGRTRTAQYDAADRIWLSTSAKGRSTTTELDTQGRPITQQVGDLASISYSYDYRGRLTDLAIGSGSGQRLTQFAYDNWGNLASTTDSLRRTTYFDYDLADRMTRQTYPDGRSVDYQYDNAGNLTAIIPPGREAHVFSYNRVNLEDAYTPPDLSGIQTITRYEYNRDQQLTRIDRPDGRTVNYNYDTGGRLSKLSIARGQYRNTYHDDTGQLSTITAPDGGSVSYSYDGFLPLSETWSGAVAGSVSRSYDNNFWLTERCVNGSNCVSFNYDDDGLLIAVAGLNLTRHAQHGLITDTALASVSTHYSYNSFGEPVDYQARASGNNLANIEYQRDDLGRITTKTETIGGNTVSESYQYDTTGRLTAVTHNGQITTWKYDSNGNRTHENGIPIASYDGQDRLLSYKDASYSYTANGELQSKTRDGAVSTYHYDEIGNLISAALPGDINIQYLVDGRNRRIGKKVNGQLVQGFLYADRLNPIAELDNNGNIKSRFVYAGKANVPAYMIKEGTTYRIISDHLGSPRLVVTTNTGEVVQRMDYDAWGNVIADTNPGFQPFGFAGGIYDQHTGLVRFGARDYDSETARWANKDPIRFEGADTNLYGYVLGDPVNFIDPEGERLRPQGGNRGYGAGGTYSGAGGRYGQVIGRGYHNQHGRYFPPSVPIHRPPPPRPMPSNAEILIPNNSAFHEFLKGVMELQDHLLSDFIKEQIREEICRTNPGLCDPLEYGDGLDCPKR